MTGDELKRYRFPETLTNQSRWFGLYLDELIRGLTLNGTVSHVKDFLSDKSEYCGQ